MTKKKNTVIEYYEPYHDKPLNKIRDEKRQEEIINFLNCNFIILKGEGYGRKNTNDGDNV